MCGRYVNPATAEAERYFAVHLIRWKFDRSYNVAPTQQVPVVRLADGQREGLMMRWGLMMRRALTVCRTPAPRR